MLQPSLRLCACRYCCNFAGSTDIEVTYQGSFTCEAASQVQRQQLRINFNLSRVLHQNWLDLPKAMYVRLREEVWRCRKYLLNRTQVTAAVA